MSEKVSSIPVKRKINTSSSSSHDKRLNEKHSPAHQMSKSEKCNKKPQVTDMTETKSNTSELTNNAKDTKDVTELTSQNGTKDSLGNGESTTSNPDMEIRETTVSSFHYNSDQTLLYYIVLVLITLLAFATRLYKIEVPSWVW